MSTRNRSAHRLALDVTSNPTLPESDDQPAGEPPRSLRGVLIGLLIAIPLWTAIAALIRLLFGR